MKLQKGPSKRKVEAITTKKITRTEAAFKITNVFLNKNERKKPQNRRHPRISIVLKDKI